jgi:hypothetical protein
VLEANIARGIHVGDVLRHRANGILAGIQATRSDVHDRI